MIRTARIILAGLLHVLAAKVDVHDTYIVEIDIDMAEGYRATAELDIAIAENAAAFEEYNEAVSALVDAVDENTMLHQRINEIGRWN